MSTDAIRYLAASVRWIRRYRKMTQQELAARAGISRNTISAIECGRANPRLDVLQALAGALDCTLSLKLAGERSWQPVFFEGVAE